MSCQFFRIFDDTQQKKIKDNTTRRRRKQTSFGIYFRPLTCLITSEIANEKKATFLRQGESLFEVSWVTRASFNFFSLPTKMTLGAFEAHGKIIFILTTQLSTLAGQTEKAKRIILFSFLSSLPPPFYIQMYFKGTSQQIATITPSQFNKNMNARTSRFPVSLALLAI